MFVCSMQACSPLLLVQVIDAFHPLGDVIRIERPAVSLVSSFPGNYYHALTEFLIRSRPIATLCSTSITSRQGAVRAAALRHWACRLPVHGTAATQGTAFSQHFAWTDDASQHVFPHATHMLQLVGIEPQSDWIHLNITGSTRSVTCQKRCGI